MPVAPYGSWPSPLAASSLVAGSVSLRDLHVDGEDAVWVEGRPEEAGRHAVVRRHGERREPVDVLPSAWSARSTVHEYGGGALAVHRGTLFFVNEADQRIWRLDPGHAPVALTPEPELDRSIRFGDLDVDAAGRRLVCVRERHRCSGEVVDDVVMVPTSGGRPTVVASGRDFYAAPRFGPGGRLAWLCWDQPNMPWDGAELWTVAAGRVAGGPDESISQPRWAPDGRLAWCSDRTGWWNLYLEGEAVLAEEAEFSGADWVLGQSTYGFLGDGRMAAVRTDPDGQRLVVVDVVARTSQVLALPFNAFPALRARRSEIVAVAASPVDAPAVVGLDPATGDMRILRRSRPPLENGAELVSVARPVTYPTAGGLQAHALLYPPGNPGWQAPDGERPPLVVTAHGGPTGQASPAFDVGIQFWTTRGFAVADVDYRGSTGYGRAFRRSLDGAWGVADVEDCVAAAAHVAGQGLVDGARMVIRGRSAGGLTVLGALGTSNVFAAGATHYGVTDLSTLVADTHKFEARYLDRLVGPWPDARERYEARSPARAAGRIAAPVILFHGTEDRVVPPSQAEAMAQALRASGVPCALVLFPGEGHGFRRAESVVRAIEAELWFYSRVLGFTPSDEIEAVPVDPPFRPHAARE